MHRKQYTDINSGQNKMGVYRIVPLIINCTQAVIHIIPNSIQVSEINFDSVDLQDIVHILISIF